MKLLILLPVALVMALLLPSPCGAAGDATRTVTLREAIIMALDGNHQLRSAALNAQAAGQLPAIAASRSYPQLFVQESLTGSDSPTQTFMMKLDQGRFTQDDFRINNLNHPGVWHDFRTALTLTQALYDPVLSPTREIARLEADQARAEYEAARQDTAFRVFVLYLEGKRGAARVRAVEQALLDGEENVRLAGVRLRDGVGLRSDLLRAETHRATVEQELVTARNDVTLARMRMGLALGLGEGSQVEVTGDPPLFTPSHRPEELVEMALRERGELRRSRAERDRGEAALRLARSAYLPSLDAVASYQLDSREHPFGSDNDVWMAGVSLKWQLFDGFRRGKEEERALAARSAAAEQLRAKSGEIRLQLRESLLRRDEAGKRREVAGRALQAAEEAVRLLTRRFENSLATMAELLEAQTSLNQTRARLVDAEADSSYAGGRVLYEAGFFLKEMVK